jgi:AcrR family transcriptional regulator
MTIQLVGMTARPNPARRERILHEAEQLFFARGLKGVSMDEVAAAAGVKKANLFHYYPSKEALEVAVLDRFSAELRDSVAASSPRRQDPDRGHRPHVRGGPRRACGAAASRGGCFAGNLAQEASDHRESVRTRGGHAAALLGGGGRGPAERGPRRRATSGATSSRGACGRGHPVAVRRRAALLQGEPQERRHRQRARDGDRLPAGISREVREEQRDRPDVDPPDRILRIERKTAFVLGATTEELMSTVVLNSLPAAELRRRQEARKARRRFYPSTVSLHDLCVDGRFFGCDQAGR